MSQQTIKMNPSNKIIHGMWIGNELSKMEILTIKSFVANGHVFYLWVYDNPTIPEIGQLVIKDACEIIPREEVFSYKNKNKFGHGKGSYAGFSDIFRYKLLHEYGGWWVDMDVTCLKTFDFDSPYVFRSHHELDVVGNVMKCPKRAKVMLDSYNEAIQEVDDENTDWHKPIEILNKHIKNNKLTSSVRSNMSYEDDWRVISRLIKNNKEIIREDVYFIHWLNEEWRARQISKDIFRYCSHLGNVMNKYGLRPENLSTYAFIENYLKTSDFYENMRILNIVT